MKYVFFSRLKKFQVNVDYFHLQHGWIFSFQGADSVFSFNSCSV